MDGAIEVEHAEVAELVELRADANNDGVPTPTTTVGIAGAPAAIGPPVTGLRGDLCFSSYHSGLLRLDRS